jgi:hypothetical protein
VTLAVVVKSTTPVALLTVKPVKLPKLVIFGCAFVYTVPATNALATCPEILAACMLLKLLPKPIKKLAVTLLPNVALAPVMLPLAVNVLADITLPPAILPGNQYPRWCMVYYSCISSGILWFLAINSYSPIYIGRICRTICSVPRVWTIVGRYTRHTTSIPFDTAHIRSI